MQWCNNTHTDIFNMVNVKTSVILLLFLDTTYCFFAENKPYGSGTDTKAHTEITYIGCSIAIQKYVIAKKNSTSISDFFKQGMLNVYIRLHLNVWSSDNVFDLLNIA